MNLQSITQSTTLLACLLLSFGLGAAVASEQARYPTPDDAVDALIAAAVADDPSAVLAVLGPDVAELRSGDPVADVNERAAFAALATESAKIEEWSDDHAILTVGPDDWPFPIPLVRDEHGWRFDTAAGAEELLNRRVGRNELTVIAVARALVEAQHEYASIDRNGDGVREYAQRLMSTEGKRDGLYWPAPDGEAESPVGRLIAEAVAEGYAPGEQAEPRPYHGYLFRLVDARGDGAPGGAKDYRDEQNRLVHGFAVIAYPAEYGASGIMTFEIDESGLLFQKDLGEETAAQAATITAFAPDRTWTPVVD